MAEDIRERTTLPLGVPLGIFAAVLVYIRLDERTRGAYTRWLQAGVAVVLASTGVGLWMLP